MCRLTSLALDARVRIGLIGTLVFGWVTYRLTASATIGNAVAGQVILGAALGLMFSGLVLCFVAANRSMKRHSSSDAS